MAFASSVQSAPSGITRSSRCLVYISIHLNVSSFFVGDSMNGVFGDGRPPNPFGVNCNPFPSVVGENILPSTPGNDGVANENGVKGIVGEDGDS
jgi:hypothetical protein